MDGRIDGGLNGRLIAGNVDDHTRRIGRIGESVAVVISKIEADLLHARIHVGVRVVAVRTSAGIVGIPVRVVVPAEAVILIGSHVIGAQ